MNKWVLRVLSRLVGFVAIAAVMLTSVSPARAQCPPQWIAEQGLPGVSGFIDAMTLWDPDGSGPAAPLLVIGGSIQVAGSTLVSNIAAWDGTTWTPLGSGINGTVYALATFQGRLIAGGAFTNADGVTVSNIAAWDGTTWSPLGAGIGTSANTVESLAVFNNALFAGGSFTAAGGIPASCIARWDGASWSALGAGINGQVLTMAVASNALIVGGSFSTAGGSSAANVAAWSGATWNATGGGLNGGVSSLTFFNGTLYAGGSFTMTGAAPVAHIARLVGASWTAVGSGITSADIGGQPDVTALGVFNNSLYVSGSFTAAGGVLGRGVLRWDGTAWHPVAANGDLTNDDGSTSYAVAFATFNGVLIAGGRFDQASGARAYRIARLGDAGWSSLTAGTDGPIYATTLFNGQLVAGGGFTRIGNIAANRIAVWDGASWAPLGAGFDGAVDCLAVYNNQLYAGGVITSSGSTPLHGIAMWDGAAWQPLANGLMSTTGAANPAYAMAVYQNKLFVGGAFRNANNVAGTFGLASWNGSIWQSVGGGVISQNIQALAVYNNELIVGGAQGAFTADPVSGANIARWNGSIWRRIGDLSGALAPGVNTLLNLNSTLYAGGSFTQSDSVTVNGVARWDGTTWQPLGTGLTKPHLTCETLVLGSYHGQLVAGGTFTVAGAAPSVGVARWDGANWLAMTPGTGIIGPIPSVYALQEFNDQLWISGVFSGVAGQGSFDLVRWTTSCDSVPDLTDLGGGVATASTPLAVGGVKWFRFSLDHNIIGPPNGPLSYLDIDTESSALVPHNDTMIGLYRDDGTLVAFDDDDGSGAGGFNLSQLSFGAGGGVPVIGNSHKYDGRDGNFLPAGVYEVAVTGFPATFSTQGWNVVSTSGFTGPLVVNIRSGAILPGTPCNLADIASVGQEPPPDGLLTGDDYIAFINAFFTGNLQADVVSVGQQPPPDGLLTGDDYVAFINAFFTGC